MDERTEEVRKLQARAHGMLPGVAGICMFMLVLTLMNAFAALRGSFGDGRGKYGVLMLCTLLAAGVFGLLRLRRVGLRRVGLRLRVLPFRVLLGPRGKRDQAGEISRPVAADVS